jgi:HJR/Mrr/RecB family endonuclease
LAGNFTARQRFCKAELRRRCKSLEISHIAGNNQSVKPKHKLSFNRLSDVEFEEFCYDLLEELGFVNLDWRKGTGKKSSPSDSGRDIVAHLQRTDIDRTRRSEKWFVDCKHYQKGVPAKELQNLLAWAEAERPDVALFIVSNFLSNPAKDFLEAYKRNNRPPFEVKYWERPMLESMTRGRRDFLQMYGLLKSHRRPESEIVKAEAELWDRVWYYRHMIWMEKVKTGKQKASQEIIKMAWAAVARKRKQYGPSIARYMSDFDWGYIQGKFSAIRWVLGEEWDFLDT